MNYIRALFDNPEIYIEIPKDYDLMFEIERKVPVRSCFMGDTILISVGLSINCRNVVRNKLWRYKFEIEEKTTNAGEKHLFFHFIRRRKFLFF